MLKITLATIALALVAGCFNEPTPAYKTVKDGQRLYFSDKGLHNLATLDGLTPEVDYLNLDRNNLTNITPIAEMSGLKWLRLNDNKLDSLPDLSKLVSLKRIYLKNNKFASVPEELRNLPSLTDIELSGNPIAEIPQWLSEKQGLLHLSFSHTKLTKLPQNLEAWKSLRSLQLIGLDELSLEEMHRIRKALPKTAVVY